MHSGEGDSFLHSCFGYVKASVMGCCYSICHKENDAQDNTVDERTHLLEVSEQRHEAPAPVAAASPPRKPDEQSALNRILHETATNVIDVGALGPYALESAAYQERVRAYSTRLANVPAVGARPQRLLVDVAQAERAQLLAAPPKCDDVMRISSYVKRAAAAVSQLRVEHHEELVVPFRVP